MCRFKEGHDFAMQAVNLCLVKKKKKGRTITSKGTGDGFAEMCVCMYLYIFLSFRHSTNEQQPCEKHAGLEFLSYSRVLRVKQTL